MNSDIRLTRIVLLISFTLALSATAEAQSSIDKLAGQFFRGDGLGEQFSLDIRPTGRFSYALDTDVGNLEKAAGEVEIVDGRIWFSTDSGAQLGRNSPLLNWWVLVPWGQRRYLVQEEEMLRFVNEVNVGAEPRMSITGSFLLRRDDSERSVKGLPTIPEEWRGYLLKQPVVGTITRVTEDRNAEIDLGRRSGLRSGMLLMASSRSGGWIDVTVTSVTPNSSRITVDPGEAALFVGQRIVSHP